MNLQRAVCRSFSIFKMSALPHGRRITNAESADLVAIAETNSASVSESYVLAHFGDISIFSFPVQVMEQVHCSLHSLGLPWWATIVVVALGYRTLSFPLYAAHVRSSVITTAVSRRVQDYRSKMLMHLRARRFVELAAVRNRYKQFRYATGILHSEKAFFLLASTAFYVLDLLCLRLMLKTVDSLHVGGMLWFTDLTVMDPYFIFPMLFAVFSAIIRNNRAKMYRKGAQELSLTSRILMHAFPTLILFFFMRHMLPAALSLLLACNFGFIAVLSAILRYSRKARVYFNIPNDSIIFKEVEPPKEVAEKLVDEKTSEIMKPRE